MNASVPLTHELPWSLSEEGGRTFVVCDSLETDGRFLLHTLATQVLGKPGGRVLWVAGGAWTDRLIATALKKMGCDVAATYLRSTIHQSLDEASNQLQIVSLAVEMAKRMEDTLDNADFDCELYLKEFHHRIESWASKAIDQSVTQGPIWIVLDDVSGMAALFGERLVYFFVLSLRALMERLNTRIGILLRCSNDLDQQQAKNAAGEGESTVNPTSSSRVDWVGIDRTQNELYHEEMVPWERYLMEISDGIVDVLPLSSGYSREAHGRLVFTAPPGGRGWGSAKSQPQTGPIAPLSSKVFNYCLTDNAVMAIRLRGGAP